jgi:hypothetical protein
MTARHRIYILEGQTPVACDNWSEWGNFMESGDRFLFKTGNEDIEVSTVFLGSDHNYWEGPPILFETMVFGGEYNNQQERYYTWEEAEAGHKKWVKVVFPMLVVS